MHDQALPTLLSKLHVAPGPVLWLADEQALPAVSQLAPRPDLHILTNRYDVMLAAQSAGHGVSFSDFDFSGLADGSVCSILFRIAKEKAVVHHVLNHAPRLLADNGTLLLAGLKNEGIKTYVAKCRQHFGNGSVDKHGMAYLGHCHQQPGMAAAPWLDDQQYTQLRLLQLDGLDVFSKPGTFGWNKIDEGSELLVSVLPQALQGRDYPPDSLLDLGCGYGYLMLATKQLPLARRVATDNAAAALLAMQANAAHHRLAVDVIPSDAGDSIEGAFDIVLCNPPFHLGFATDAAMNNKFLRNSRRLLHKDGVALFVVNRFIPLEKNAATLFGHCDLFAENRSFQVFGLRP